MMDKITSINPKILKWARKSSNIPNEKIILTMGDSRFLEWENGDDYPTYTQLEKLMSLYNYPIAISFFSTIPDIEDIQINFRSIPNEVINDIDHKVVKLIKQAMAYQLFFEELYQYSDHTKKDNLLDNHLIIKSMDEQIDFVKKSFKNKLMNLRKIKNSKDYFDYFRDELFDLGVYIFKESFGNDSIAGFCIYHEKYPIIYINNKVSFTRQLFTLFHELYHLINRTNGIDYINDDFLTEYKYDLTIEYDCNKFAGKFLVPEDDLRIAVNFHGKDMLSIEKISHHFLVSRDVISRRLFDLNIIEFDDYLAYKKLYDKDHIREKQSSRSKQEGEFYNTQMSYLGKKYLELVYGEYYKKNISIIDLGKYTNLKYSSIIEIANRKNWMKI